MRTSRHLRLARGALRAAVISALVPLSFGACGDRTGVILEVTRDAETTPDAIDELRFYVGVAVGGDDLRGTDFLDDSSAGQIVTLDSSRDLVLDPYRLLVSPGDLTDEPVMAVVLGYEKGEFAGYGQLEQPIEFMPGAVTQWSVVLRGDPDGRVIVLDSGCLILQNEDGKVVIATANDKDCDGDAKDVDCNDADPTVGPSQSEVCFNQVDDDCDDETDEQEDADNDGVLNCEDCDDQDEHRYPGNTEVCDGIDNDCNEQCDDGEGFDGDNDKFTTCGTRVFNDGTCAGPNTNLIDCDDDDPTSHPNAPEVCDGADNDCNQVCDDGFDPDGDLFTECGSRIDVCDGVLPRDIDCEPGKDYAYPGNTPELCDGVDNDCDGVFYEPVVPCYAKVSGGGEDRCQIGTRQCGDAQGQGWQTDCTPTAGNNMPLPMGLCDAYDACTDAPDPYACANQMTMATNYSCTLSYSTSNTICKPAATVLPNTAADGAVCQWFMTPLAKRSAYTATLTTDPSSGGADVSVLADCDALFSVTSALVAPPVPGGYLFVQNVQGTMPKVVRLNISPVSVGQCNPNGGLVCTGLAVPDPN